MHAIHVHSVYIMHMHSHAYVVHCGQMCVYRSPCATQTLLLKRNDGWLICRASGSLQLQLVCKALMECMLPHVQWHILAYQYINMCYCDYKCVIN